MGKIRKPGPALLRTYIRPRTVAGSLRVQARVIDVRTGKDIKYSGDTISEAVACAKKLALPGPERKTRPRRRKKTPEIPFRSKTR
jgi:hypothetical protein